jgi:hypothetical protein
MRYLVALVALLLAATFAVTPSAQAGDYKVNVCDGAPDAGREIGLDGFNLQFSYFVFPSNSQCFGATSGQMVIRFDNDPFVADDSLTLGSLSGWNVFTGSPSLLLFGLHGEVFAPFDWTSRGMSARVTNDSGGVVRDFGAALPEGSTHQDVTFAPTGSVHVMMVCDGLAICAGPTGLAFAVSDQFNWSNPTVDVRDSDKPVFVSAPSGSLLAAGTVSGVATANFAVRDGGSGPRRVVLRIDGQQVREFANPSARCAVPYHFVVPCLGRFGVRGGPLDGSFSLDTSTLSDAQHSVVLSVEDASGDVTTQAPVQITVRNTPVNTGLPTLAGTTTVGRTQTLTAGTWTTFATTTFTDQWLRCPASVTAADAAARCLPIGGATGTTYVTTADDVGSRLALRETAQSGLKTASVVSKPGGPIAPAAGPGPGPRPGQSSFGVRSIVVSKKGAIVVSLQLPSGGSLATVASRGRLVFARKKATGNAAGVFKVTLKPSKKALAKLKRSKRLKLTVKVTFVPTGGKAVTVKRTITVKAPRK